MAPFSNLTRFSDWGLLVLRVGIGSVFIAHGLLKWGLWSMEPSEHLSASMLWILRILSIAEPLGGLAMIAGFWTSIAAIGMGVVMLGAINMKINTMQLGFIGENTTGWEFDFLVFCAAVCILLVGPGKFSLEKVLSKVKSE
ncbi:MAG: DoxX family protein [Ignavibacteriales bacterium]|nr:DoxX family protein [Ignavibacteriales bacterium]